MAYPETIPPLTPKEGKDFLQRLSKFKLTKEQEEFWRKPDQATVEAPAKKKKA